MNREVSPLDHHAALLADRDKKLAKREEDLRIAEETIAQADRATQVVQAKLNTELREHAKTKRTLADTRIHVDELERLNERLLENAKRLTSELQQVEAVRDAGIREAVAAELADAPMLTRARLEELLERERGYLAIQAQSDFLYGPDGDMSPGGPLDDEEVDGG